MVTQLLVHCVTTHLASGRSYPLLAIPKLQISKPPPWPHVLAWPFPGSESVEASFGR